MAGSDWLDTLHFAMQNFKDESFIGQYLSPKLIRDFKFFVVLDDDTKNYIDVSAIHDETGYQKIRQQLAEQYNLSNIEPNIQIYNVDINGDRSLRLRYVPHQKIPLGNSTQEVLKHLHRLWGFDVFLEQEQEDGKVHLLAKVPPNIDVGDDLN